MALLPHVLGIGLIKLIDKPNEHICLNQEKEREPVIEFAYYERVSLV